MLQNHNNKNHMEMAQKTNTKINGIDDPKIGLPDTALS
jgi:hypothetical protein